MDWQTVLSAVLGSSIGSAVITATLQHNNWIKQKRSEERLTLARGIHELSKTIDDIAWSQDKDTVVYENAISELTVLLSLAAVVFKWRRIKALALEFIRVLSEPSEDPDTRHERWAYIRSGSVAKQPAWCISYRLQTAY